MKKFISLVVFSSILLLPACNKTDKEKLKEETELNISIIGSEKIIIDPVLKKHSCKIAYVTNIIAIEGLDAELCIKELNNIFKGKPEFVQGSLLRSPSDDNRESE